MPGLRHGYCWRHVFPWYLLTGGGHYVHKLRHWNVRSGRGLIKLYGLPCRENYFWHWHNQQRRLHLGPLIRAATTSCMRLFLFKFGFLCTS
jgi:hypothetical protein